MKELHYLNFKDNDNFPPCDRKLLERMRKEYVSESERVFFETIIFKEIYQFTVRCELLMAETDNEEKVYIARGHNNEYLVGRGRHGSGEKEVHLGTLTETMDFDMAGLLCRHVTLHEWLRERDYLGIQYGRWQEDWVMEGYFDMDFNSTENFPQCDRELLERMRKEYVSNNEKVFFETMVYKEIYQFTVTFETILHENNNEEEVFIVRCYDSEYEMGRGNVGRWRPVKGHALSLSEALEYDMFYLLDRHVTLHEWLRERDYRGIRYDKWEGD